MDYKILTYEQIDRAAWAELVQTSATGTWFQTPEAYSFYESLPDLFRPFVVAISNEAPLSEAQHSINPSLQTLRAVCVGYVTVEKNAMKQFLTRRAIILGGPCLADDCINEEVSLLLSTLRQQLSTEAIYIESRNFNDYSKWKTAFAKVGFDYQPHLNFHVDTSSVEVVDANLGKNRKRDIRTTIREGVTIIEHPTDEQVCEYYKVLDNLYRTKVKTPLFPLSFFLALSKHKDGRLLLMEYQGRIIGGTVCVEQANKCVYEWFVCGEDGVYPHVFPSSYATYAGIKYASEHGCARFDMMGAGTPDEEYGVRDFKARFGGELVEHGRFLCVTKPLLYRLGVLGVKMLKRLK